MMAHQLTASCGEETVLWSASTVRYHYNHIAASHLVSPSLSAFYSFEP
jgi:hypothetical protein